MLSGNNGSGVLLPVTPAVGITSSASEKPKIFAVLFDAENVSPESAQQVFLELARRGDCNLKRLYGDFTRASNKWQDVAKQHGCKVIFQYQNSSGKGSSDIALCVDAMELLFTKPWITSFAIISSDGDFTALCLTLKQHNKDVLGMGREDTPDAFQQACTEFIPLVVNSGKQKVIKSFEDGYGAGLKKGEGVANRDFEKFRKGDPFDLGKFVGSAHATWVFCQEQEEKGSFKIPTTQSHADQDPTKASLGTPHGHSTDEVASNAVIFNADDNIPQAIQDNLVGLLGVESNGQKRPSRECPNGVNSSSSSNQPEGGPENNLVASIGATDGVQEGQEDVNDSKIDWQRAILAGLFKQRAVFAGLFKQRAILAGLFTPDEEWVLLSELGQRLRRYDPSVGPTATLKKHLTALKFEIRQNQNNHPEARNPYMPLG